MRYFSSISLNFVGIFLADVQHVQHRLLRKELESANQFFFFRGQLQSSQRSVRFQRGLAAFQHRELAIQLLILQLLAILIEAFHALLDHHKIAQHEFDIDVLHVANRVHRSFFVRHRIAVEEAQDVGQSVGDTHAGEVTRVAQRFFRDGRKIEILDRGVSHLGRFEDFRQLFEARIGNLGHADASFHGPDARRFVDAGENRKQRCLAYHGQADNSCLHLFRAYRGTSTDVRISCRMRSLVSVLRCESEARAIPRRWAKTGITSRFTSSGIT